VAWIEDADAAQLRLQHRRARYAAAGRGHPPAREAGEQAGVLNGAQFPARSRLDHDVRDKQRRLQAPGNARAVLAAFEDPRRLIRGLRPQHGIDHRNPGWKVHQPIQQCRAEDRGHQRCLAPPVLGQVDDRAGRDSHSEQHDTRDGFWPAGHCLPTRAVLVCGRIFHYLDSR